MLLKYALMSRDMRHNSRLQRKLDLLGTLVRSIAITTRVKPNRIMTMDAPDPAWPIEAQRSFRAAQRIDAALKAKFDREMARLVTNYLKAEQREEESLHRMQLMLPMPWRLACGLADEKPYSRPKAKAHVMHRQRQTSKSGYQRAHEARLAKLRGGPPVQRDGGSGKATDGKNC